MGLVTLDEVVHRLRRRPAPTYDVLADAESVAQRRRVVLMRRQQTARELAYQLARSNPRMWSERGEAGCIALISAWQSHAWAEGQEMGVEG